MKLFQLLAVIDCNNVSIVVPTGENTVEEIYSGEANLYSDGDMNVVNEYVINKELFKHQVLIYGFMVGGEKKDLSFVNKMISDERLYPSDVCNFIKLISMSEDEKSIFGRPSLRRLRDCGYLNIKLLPLPKDEKGEKCHSYVYIVA